MFTAHETAIIVICSCSNVNLDFIKHLFGINKKHLVNQQNRKFYKWNNQNMITISSGNYNLQSCRRSQLYDFLYVLKLKMAETIFALRGC